MNEQQKPLHEQEPLDTYLSFSKYVPSDSNLDIAHLNTANKLKIGSGGLLTKKEALVASFLVSDYSVKEIAEAFSRSRNTIKMHIRNMKKKCKCGTQTRFGVILQGFIKNSPQNI